MVAEGQPIQKPKNINAKLVIDGVPLSIPLIRKTIAQAIKIPLLYITHDLYGLVITLLVPQKSMKMHFLVRNVFKDGI